MLRNAAMRKNAAVKRIMVKDVILRYSERIFTFKLVETLQQKILRNAQNDIFYIVQFCCSALSDCNGMERRGRRSMRGFRVYNLEKLKSALRVLCHI